MHLVSYIFVSSTSSLAHLFLQDWTITCSGFRFWFEYGTIWFPTSSTTHVVSFHLLISFAYPVLPQDWRTLPILYSLDLNTDRKWSDMTTLHRYWAKNLMITLSTASWSEEWEDKDSSNGKCTVASLSLHEILKSAGNLEIVPKIRNRSVCLCAWLCGSYIFCLSFPCLTHGNVKLPVPRVTHGKRISHLSHMYEYN